MTRARACNDERNLSALEWLASQELPPANLTRSGSHYGKLYTVFLIYESLRRGAIVEQACEVVGIDSSLFYRWKSQALKLVKAFDAMEEALINS